MPRISTQEALYEKLWSKIGTEGETYVLLDTNATLLAGGGLNATPYNLARFAMMMLHGGKFNGKQVVPASVVDKIAKGGSIEAFDNGPDSVGLFVDDGRLLGKLWLINYPGSFYGKVWFWRKESG